MCAFVSAMACYVCFGVPNRCSQIETPDSGRVACLYGAMGDTFTCMPCMPTCKAYNQGIQNTNL